VRPLAILAAMRILVALWLGLLSMSPAIAADAALPLRADHSVARQLPYPRETRAEAVWNERACWSGCGSYCAWGMAACLRNDTQGTCLTLTDRCDRACQRGCRNAGGPLLPDVFDFLN
jgi:hypothetical protein